MSSCRDYKQMIVGRCTSGEVMAAGWDLAETRQDARKWLARGLTLELVTAAQVKAITDPMHVFSTNSPIGVVLSYEQALAALSDSAINSLAAPPTRQGSGNLPALIPSEVTVFDIMGEPCCQMERDRFIA